MKTGQTVMLQAATILAASAAFTVNYQTAVDYNLLSFAETIRSLGFICVFVGLLLAAVGSVVIAGQYIKSGGKE